MGETLFPGISKNVFLYYFTHLLQIEKDISWNVIPIDSMHLMNNKLCLAEMFTDVNKKAFNIAA